jgi:hypothetical protein
MGWTTTIDIMLISQSTINLILIILWGCICNYGLKMPLLHFFIRWCISLLTSLIWSLWSSEFWIGGWAQILDGVYELKYLMVCQLLDIAHCECSFLTRVMHYLWAMPSQSLCFNLELHMNAPLLNWLDRRYLELVHGAVFGLISVNMMSMHFENLCSLVF